MLKTLPRNMELLTPNSGVKRCCPDNRRNIIDRPEDFALNRIFTALLMALLFAAFFFFFLSTFSTVSLV